MSARRVPASLGLSSRFNTFLVLRETAALMDQQTKDFHSRAAFMSSSWFPITRRVFTLVLVKFPSLIICRKKTKNRYVFLGSPAAAVRYRPVLSDWSLMEAV
ncbi:hypothetical protein FQA47_018248 [Oryzias melastigma]|uniref:Uncharacterized protein n=1 Tax=Oryzias melastigma TaxID=30732 RepID=A0A834FVC7_ORYME|nr:hypothetical protein FQA47_018248 [Oryzias melastigma]